LLINNNVKKKISYTQSIIDSQISHSQHQVTYFGHKSPIEQYTAFIAYSYLRRNIYLRSKCEFIHIM